MHPLATIINAKYHPGNQTFTVASSEQVKAEGGLNDEELDAAWDTIAKDLEQAGLVMYPALPDTNKGENVRVFRTNTTISRLLQEVLFPTSSGNAFVANAAAALNHPPRRK